MAGLGGCRDPRRIPRPQAGAARVSSVTDSDPSSVAKAFLDACRVMTELGRQGMRDDQSKQRFADQEARLMALVDREGVAAAWGSAWGHLGGDASRRERRIDSVVKNWPSIIAHYVEGVDPNSLVVVPRGQLSLSESAPIPETAGRIAVVAAERPGTSERLRGIQSSATQASGLQGERLQPGTPSYEAFVNRRAVEQGLSPHPMARIVLGLRETGRGWRVLGVQVAAGPEAERSAVRPEAPATQAASRIGP